MTQLKLASMFSGLGGIELGLSQGNPSIKPVLFCECHADAVKVLRHHFPDVPIHPDIRTLTHLPEDVEIVSAGSPCCDFSVSNSEKAGIDGEKSSLLREIFRLLEKSTNVKYVILENVANMLYLNKGKAVKELCSELTRLGFAWAYRVVDARAFGLRQRRRRFVCIASKVQVPAWLVRDSFEPPASPAIKDAEFASFYWVDGTRGCGFSLDCVPTIRAHATLNLASQPAIIWLKTGQVCILSIEDGERLQGLPVGWTSVLEDKKRFGRIGNSVPVRLFRWISENLTSDTLTHETVPATHPARVLIPGVPKGCVCDFTGTVTHQSITEWPLVDVQKDASPTDSTQPLSQRQLRGFLSRALKGRPGTPSEVLNLLQSKVE